MVRFCCVVFVPVFMSPRDASLSVSTETLERTAWPHVLGEIRGLGADSCSVQQRREVLRRWVILGERKLEKMGKKTVASAKTTATAKCWSTYKRKRDGWDFYRSTVIGVVPTLITQRVVTHCAILAASENVKPCCPHLLTLLLNLTL